eukprot:TRINITY_DN6263_c0_g1_i2.p1 TRINITY_DN6263_c0_g1~~TRINITY_DN6263_c0_g1_i2.p1  ORF type:complete len:306 (-),score=106.00 TRINITY_DN6263_c0_g1_i2:195-1112(-)
MQASSMVAGGPTLSARAARRRSGRWIPRAVAAIVAGCAVLALPTRRHAACDGAAFVQAPTGQELALYHSVATASPSVQKCLDRRPARESSATWAFAAGLAALGASAAISSRAAAVARQAISEIGMVKLELKAGKATPAPPVGPAMGKFGGNIMQFCKEYNAITQGMSGTVPCRVHFFSDRSFKIQVKTPLTAELLYQAVGKDRGSGKAGTEIIGSISVDKLKEIAEIKLPDLNVKDVTRAMKIIHGTAVATGVAVDGYDEWLSQQFCASKPASILERYGPGLENIPKDGDAAPAEEEKVAEEATA